MLPFWRLGKVVKSLAGIVFMRDTNGNSTYLYLYIFLHGIFAYMNGWDQCRLYAGIPYMDIFFTCLPGGFMLWIFHGGFVDFYVNQRLKPI